MKKWLTYYSVLPSIADYKTPDEKRNQVDLKEEEISVYEVWLKEWSVEAKIEEEKEEDTVYIVADDYQEFKGTKQELFEEIDALFDAGILDGDIVDEWEVYNGKEVTQLKIFEGEEQTYRKFYSEEWYLSEVEALEAVKASIAYGKKNY
tara:strand:+ start:332 stop:778 length:447 start_codon:yes stop_codon:yes gene_type:complete